MCMNKCVYSARYEDMSQTKKTYNESIIQFGNLVISPNLPYRRAPFEGGSWVMVGGLRTKYALRKTSYVKGSKG